MASRTFRFRFRDGSEKDTALACLQGAEDSGRFAFLHLVMMRYGALAVRQLGGDDEAVHHRFASDLRSLAVELDAAMEEIGFPHERFVSYLAGLLSAYGGSATMPVAGESLDARYVRSADSVVDPEEPVEEAEDAAGANDSVLQMMVGLQSGG